MSDAQRLAAQRAIEGLGVVPDAIVVDGNWDFVSRAAPTAKVHRMVKADAHVPDGLDGVGARQGHARPHDASGGRALPRLRLRRQQGLPVPAAQGCARGVGADVDPPAHVGVHGPPALAGDASPPAGAGTAVRSLIAPAGVTSAARSRSRSRSRCSSRRARRPCRAACSRSGPSLRGSLRPLPRTRRGCRPTGQ